MFKKPKKFFKYLLKNISRRIRVSYLKESTRWCCGSRSPEPPHVRSWKQFALFPSDFLVSDVEAQNSESSNEEEEEEEELTSVPLLLLGRGQRLRFTM